MCFCPCVQMHAAPCDDCIRKYHECKDACERMAWIIAGRLYLFYTCISLSGRPQPHHRSHTAFVQYQKSEKMPSGKTKTGKHMALCFCYEF